MSQYNFPDAAFPQYLRSTSMPQYYPSQNSPTASPSNALIEAYKGYATVSPSPLLSASSASGVHSDGLYNKASTTIASTVYQAPHTGNLTCDDEIWAGVMRVGPYTPLSRLAQYILRNHIDPWLAAEGVWFPGPGAPAPPPRVQYYLNRYNIHLPQYSAQASSTVTSGRTVATVGLGHNYTETWSRPASRAGSVSQQAQRRDAGKNFGFSSSAKREIIDLTSDDPAIPGSMNQIPLATQNGQTVVAAPNQEKVAKAPKPRKVPARKLGTAPMSNGEGSSRSAPKPAPKKRKPTQKNAAVTVANDGDTSGRTPHPPVLEWQLPTPTALFYTAYNEPRSGVNGGHDAQTYPMPRGMKRKASEEENAPLPSWYTEVERPRKRGRPA